jgi:hypothetical protein
MPERRAGAGNPKQGRHPEDPDTDTAARHHAASSRTRRRRGGNRPGLNEELDKHLGLGSHAPKTNQRCPYGEPPDVEIRSESEWLINDTPQTAADATLCQAIITTPHACTGCPLNIKSGSSDEPSGFLKHILYLSEIQSSGVVLSFDELSRLEIRGLALLVRKRNEKQVADMKRDQPRPG